MSSSVYTFVYIYIKATLEDIREVISQTTHLRYHDIPNPAFPESRPVVPPRHLTVRRIVLPLEGGEHHLRSSLMLEATPLNITFKQLRIFFAPFFP